MAINERVITGTQEAAAAAGNAGEEGLILHLDANDVDSYDGDGTEWVDIANHEYKPATNPSEHFNTVLYTGTGASNPITGVGFQPDLIWVKRRNTNGDSYIVDTVRGNGTSTYKNLASDTTNAEGTTTTRGITNNTIVDGGFTMQGTGVRTNASGSTYVAWCFKAGGAAVSNTDGSITSSVSANNDLGFSIVKWEGDGTSATIGHGLDVAPELIIKKNLDSSSDWAVNTFDRGGDYMFLNKTDAENSSSQTSNTTTFTSSGTFNADNDDFIAYCFATKRGVSKVGSYEGTGTSGNKIYTGFEPAWLLIKNADDTGKWSILDNTRDTDGTLNEYLYADSDEDEATAATATVKINRDGFTIGDSNSINLNRDDDTFIYLAFAKDTNETDLIDDTDLELHLDAASYSGSGSTWTADTGSDGTITGAAYDEELGDWFDFDGVDDIVDMGTTVAKQVGMTYEMWFSLDSASTRYGLFSNYTTVGGNKGLTIRHVETGKMQIDGYGTGGISNRLFRQFDTSLVANKWYHLAMVVTSSSATLYIDGEEQTQTNDSNYNKHNGTVLFASAATARLGVSYETSNYLSGRIGQFRTYESELSQDQIRQNFNFTKNDYPNGYNGTISGATWNSSGYFDFDGNNDYVKIDPLPIRNYTCSHSFWMKTTDSSGYYVTSFRNPIYFGFGLGIVSSGKFCFAMYDGTNAYNLEMSTADSNTIMDGNWHHIVLTNGNSVGKIYLDGVYNSQIATSTTQFSFGSVNAIGQRADLINNSPYDGFISKFKVYDKELTQAEITALYNEGE